MKKILSTLVVFFLSLSFTMADNYHDKLVKLIELENSSFGEKTVTSQLSDMLMKRDSLTADEAQKRATTFWNEKMMPSIVNIMEKHYRQNITEKQLDDILAFMNTKEGKTALEHTMNAINEEHISKMQEQLMPIIMALFQGQEPPAIQLTASEAYKGKFAKMVKKSGAQNSVKNTLATTMDMIKGQMFANLNDEAKTKATNLINRLTTYVSDNITDICLLMMEDDVTEADLDLLNNFYDTPSGEAYVTGNAAAVEDITTNIIQMLMQEIGMSK